MKRSNILLLLMAAASLVASGWTPAGAKTRTDFALFDGTNPANVAAGAVCVVTGGRSATNGGKVLCLSCDNDADGDGACDRIVPN